MALYPQLEGDAEAALKAGTREIYRRASEKLGAENTVLHDLRPEDVGAANAAGYGTVNMTSANTFVDVITSGGNTIANNRWILINGFANAEGDGEITLVRVNRGQATAKKWSTNGVRLWEHTAAWTNYPVIVNDNTNVTLALAARAVNTAADFTFIGVVADRKGAAINP